jgi:hypothetical protein
MYWIYQKSKWGRWNLNLFLTTYVEIDEALTIFDEKVHKKRVEVLMFKSMMPSLFVCSIEDTNA